MGDGLREADGNLIDQTNFMQPGDVADVVLFLASPLSRGIHGQSLNVYGGVGQLGLIGPTCRTSMKLGINSYTFMWSIGFQGPNPAYPDRAARPAQPLTRWGYWRKRASWVWPWCRPAPTWGWTSSASRIWSALSSPPMSGVSRWRWAHAG